MSKTLRAVMISTVLAFAFAGTAQGWDKGAARAAAEQLTEELAGTTFVAKLTLGAAQHYYVLPDGTPADEKGKRQGKGVEDHRSLWTPGGKIKVAEGQIGRSIYVWAKKKEIMVGLHDKPNAVLNAAIVHILFDRETTPSDFEASKIAQALVSLVEVEGYEPGRAIEEAFDEAIDRLATEAAARGPAAAAASSAPTPPPKPTVATVSASASPVRVAVGETVELLLDYEIVGAASSALEVVERRTLAYGGSPLPGYPSEQTTPRLPGVYQTAQPQTIPAGAPAGIYEFRGEVCVGGDCIARTVNLEIR